MLWRCLQLAQADLSLERREAQGASLQLLREQCKATAALLSPFTQALGAHHMLALELVQPAAPSSLLVSACILPLLLLLLLLLVWQPGELAICCKRSISQMQLVQAGATSGSCGKLRPASRTRSQPAVWIATFCQGWCCPLRMARRFCPTEPLAGAFPSIMGKAPAGAAGPVAALCTRR